MNKKKKLARLMKDEQFKFTPGEKLIEFYRENPIEACKDILGIDLMWHQRIILRELWFKSFCLINISRGVGKSFMFLIFAILQAILYPDIQIGFITPTYRQVRRYLFPEIDKLIKRNPMLKACVDGKLSTALDGCMVKFKNGSFIEGLPPGNDGKNIRGRRYHVILGDEFAQIDEQLIKEVIRPMGNIEIHDRENKYHVASTPYYKWNHFWPSYLHHIRECIRLPKLFGLVEFDWRDVNETPVSGRMKKLPYRVNENMLNMQRNDMTVEQFRMENLARFPDETTTYFPSALLDFASPRREPGPVKIEFTGAKFGDYVLGIDVARRVDNFAISVVKNDAGRRKLVQMKTLNKMTYMEMHALVRLTLKDFPGVSAIAIGSGGGGDALKDLLAEPYNDPDTGEEMPRILCHKGDDDRHDLLTGQHIVHMIDESGKLNNIMYTSMKSDMEHRRWLMPPPRVFADNESPKEVRAMKEIIKTNNEFLALQAIPVAIGHRFEPAEKGIRKDRATACVLANYILTEKKKEVKHPNVEIPVGFYV